MVAEELERDLERLHPQSFAWSLACCGGDRTEAEEVLQLTYLKILERRARFDGRSSLKTWLFSVICRTAAGARRKAAVRRVLLERWSAERADPGPRSDPQDKALRSEQSETIHHALAALSLRQRQILELTFFHDLSLSESARVLGVSLGTARTHYARGKSELARALGEVEG